MHFQLWDKPEEYKIRKLKNQNHQTNPVHQEVWISYFHSSIIYKRYFPKDSIGWVYTNKPSCRLQYYLHRAVHGSSRSLDPKKQKRGKCEHWGAGVGYSPVSTSCPTPSMVGPHLPVSSSKACCEYPQRLGCTVHLGTWAHLNKLEEEDVHFWSEWIPLDQF